MFRSCALPLIALLSLFQYSSLDNPHWDYQRYGPDTWPHAYETCDGDGQSPIDIRTSKLIYDSNFRPLILNGYTGNDSSYLWQISHNGYTIVARPPVFANLSIAGADLTDEFYLDHLHFHWGYNIYQGSEHTIDGMKYPLEMHFVHRNRYSRMYAVLSVLFKVRYEENPSLDELLSIINETNDVSISIERPMNLSRLFSSTSSPRFYRYNGSFTTPPCTEGVQWIILARFIPIAPSQLNVFIRNSIPMNFRSTQKLNSRVISSNFLPESYDEEDHRHSSASTHSISFILLLLYFFT